ncbi:MAG: DNA-directed RNA polymerase subunit H [Candidatus Parvarchaeota archaeon]|nr:DNA-directed RNA polymerase subunit H [Candidatus Jingweiarchaeum tengchongense]MCW1298195.1 DNA-directed RNA polymerase subunit H [Candidatus Jingweiarchaeum tengchongense]MCW1299993.1 DNA-directed RNA polymerase subunit H [Candidatus Jingweiarchaeum tengchongense]MCW1305017.1 DNA-directed RNA polymerase subunit H [Candidatus Jingweiarchaeum tengchongense]MCW1305458.1 DNA-directed RNA polymerase subunit H [Candidatus Jingweiarchaeum tengchongense]
MEKKKLDLFAHIWVPKHRIMSEEEKEELLKKYNITLQQLPRILVNDPICKELKAKVGDVIEIERDSPTAGKAMYYRVVVLE